jgi:hypothetical protein
MWHFMADNTVYAEILHKYSKMSKVNGVYAYIMDIPA